MVTIPACPSLILNIFFFFFFSRSNNEGTNSKQILWSVFVCICFVLCEFVSGLILQIFEDCGFDDLCAE